MINSRAKGARAEREWRDVLRSMGYTARRGQQYSGSPDSPDVVCEDLPIHWECKAVEALNIYNAVTQAVTDCATNKFPAVAHKKNHKPWLVTMRADDFLYLVRFYESCRKALNANVANGGKADLPRT